MLPTTRTSPMKDIKERKVKGSKKCVDCRRTFKTQEFTSHCCASGPFTCDYCKLTFNKYLKRLSDHIVNNHLKVKNRYSCDRCGLVTKSFSKLKIHILSTHDGIEFRCKKCNKLCSSRGQLGRHKCQKYECTECDKAWYIKSHLTNHLKCHSKKTVKQHKCPHCNSLFSRFETYNSHVSKLSCCKAAKMYWIENYEPKRCKLCSNDLSCEQELLTHFAEEHVGLPYQCHWCEVQFSTFDDLVKHVSQHINRAVSCDACGKKYSSMEGYRKHRLKHDDNTFNCHYCDKTFLIAGRLEKHINKCEKNPDAAITSANKKPGEFCCHYCGKFFLVNKRLENHVNKCQKNPDVKKSSRQLNWESRIVVKKVRNLLEEICDTPGASQFEDDCDDLSARQGWFDNYYKTDEDDLPVVHEDLNVDTQSDVDAVEPLEPAVEAPPSPAPSQDYESSDCSGEEVEENYGYNPKSCRICETTYGQEYELIHHFIMKHQDTLPHKCPHCDEVSPLFAQLKEHMKNHGIGLNIYNCGNCSKTFRTRQRLSDHSKKCIGNVMTPIKADTCKRCGKSYQTKFSYRRHKKVCKVERKWKRSKVADDFFGGEDERMELSEPEDLKKGNAEVNEKLLLESAFEEPVDGGESLEFKAELANGDGIQKLGSITVDGCEKLRSQPIDGNESEKLGSQSIDGNQIEKSRSQPTEGSQSAGSGTPSVDGSEKKKGHAINEPPKDSFPCRLCPEKFQFERGIVMHFRAEHPHEKPLTCHVCGIGLADKLKEHLKTHGIGEEFVCELCGRRFNQKFVGKIHELWHQGIEYKCENCKQKFLNKEKMDKHIAAARCKNRMSLMMLPCDVCGKSYRSKFGLNNHLMTHTPKHLRPMKKGVSCEVCGRWFDTNNGLERHRRVHTGERPYCCRYCPKAFTQEGNCKAHERIHTGESRPRKKKKAEKVVWKDDQVTLLKVDDAGEVTEMVETNRVGDDGGKSEGNFPGNLRQFVEGYCQKTCSGGNVSNTGAGCAMKSHTGLESFEHEVRELPEGGGEGNPRETGYTPVKVREGVVVTVVKDFCSEDLGEGVLIDTEALYSANRAKNVGGSLETVRVKVHEGIPPQVLAGYPQSSLGKVLSRPGLPSERKEMVGVPVQILSEYPATEKMAVMSSSTGRTESASIHLIGGLAEREGRGRVLLNETNFHDDISLRVIQGYSQNSGLESRQARVFVEGTATLCEEVSLHGVQGSPRGRDGQSQPLLEGFPQTLYLFTGSDLTQQH